MAFSMTKVNYKKTNIKQIASDCFRFIREHVLLTDNIRYALNAYVNYRLKHRYNHLSVETLNTLIINLLEYSCGKEYIKLCKQDVINNEIQIIFEIKKAIKYGATKCLYYSNIINLDKFVDGEECVQYPKFKQNYTIKDVEDYFSDIVV